MAERERKERYRGRRIERGGEIERVKRGRER
jgi:hypothetical protein